MRERAQLNSLSGNLSPLINKYIYCYIINNSEDNGIDYSRVCILNVLHTVHKNIINITTRFDEKQWKL